MALQSAKQVHTNVSPATQVIATTISGRSKKYASMVVQKENVYLKIAIQLAYTHAAIQKNQGFPTPHIIVNMDPGIMIKLVKEIAINRLENAKLYALQANINVKEMTQCVAKTDFGQTT